MLSKKDTHTTTKSIQETLSIFARVSSTTYRGEPLSPDAAAAASGGKAAPRTCLMTEPGMARAPVEFQNGRDCVEENELLLLEALAAVAGGSSEELNREAILERPAEKLMAGVE